MADVPQLTGPTVAPVSGGPPQQLVILLHGIGSDGDDLIGLVPFFQKVLPEAFFISPNAPGAFDMAPQGFQWFSLQDDSPAAMLAGAQGAAPVLDAFIDQQLAATGLTEDKLALIGFSQGTMMALHVGPRRASPIAGILGYSGMLVAPELLAETIKSRPPVYLVHGDADEIVPVSALPTTVAGLDAVGIDVKFHSCPGLGHGLDDDGIGRGMEFLAGIFGVDLEKMAKRTQP